MNILNQITGGSTYTAFCKGDILFGKLRPYLKKYYFADFDGICCTEIWAIRSKVSTYNRFLYYVISSDKFNDYINSKTFGTKMPRADWKTASNFSMPKLSKKDQIKWCEKIEKIQLIIDNLNAEILKVSNIEKKC